jgi:toxin-antitoxin system PIN domain toxin
LILADVNALVYAFRAGTTFHQLARESLTTYRGRGELVVLTDVASSFIRIVTDPRMSVEPDTARSAIAFIDALTVNGRFLREPRVSRWSEFVRLGDSGDIRGPLIPDALLAATCLDWGAAIVTADRDFLTFPGVRVHLLTSIGIIDHTVN